MNWVRLIGFKKPHFSPKFMIRVLDEKGRVLKQKRAMTLSIHGMTALLCLWAGANVGGTFLKNTAGVGFITAANVITNGTVTIGDIGVGTSSSAFNANDFELTAKIANGAGAGQLTYGAMSRPPGNGMAQVGNTCSFVNSKPFTNNSAAPITVNEVALYVGLIDSGSAAQLIMFDRTLFTFTIPVGQARTVQYVIANQ